MHIINNAFTFQADQHLGVEGNMNQYLTNLGTGAGTDS